MTDKRKHNALKHGVFSGTQLLPGEDEAEFMRHVMRVLEEFAPSGPIEIDCVATIAKYSWRKFNLNFEAYQKFDPYSFNRRLDLEAKCDAMIDRAIKRLLQVRGIKSLASSPALAPKETPNSPHSSTGAIASQGHVDYVPLPDLSRPIDWAPLLDGVDAVVHLARIAHSVPGTPDGACDRINRVATADLAQAGRAVCYETTNPATRVTA